MEPEYAIVELMGHQRFGAKIQEAELLGIKMLRCEVLTNPPYERDVHPQSLYAITRCTEERARFASRHLFSPAVMPAERPLTQLGAPDDDPENDDIPFRSACDDRPEDPDEEESIDAQEFECGQCGTCIAVELYGEIPDVCPEDWYAVPPRFSLIGREDGTAEYLCSRDCARLFLLEADKEPDSSGGGENHEQTR